MDWVCKSILYDLSGIVWKRTKMCIMHIRYISQTELCNDFISPFIVYPISRMQREAMFVNAIDIIPPPPTFIS